MASVSSCKLYHSSLKTTFHGIHHPNSTNKGAVAQFRGIKFASIPARWQQSRLFEDYPDSYDATKHGPSCPQGFGSIQIEDVLNGFSEEQVKSISIHEPYQVDEFECLNLVVTAPEGVRTLDKLPVMICIHGGGNISGRNSSWFNDGGALVAKSVEMGKPMVFVGLNYRLGCLGWLASQELLEDNRKAGDNGVGNYGNHDLHLGIEWVYRNIGPFGGDAHNLTILGESAGSINVMNQVHSLLPGRFCRAVFQSGGMSYGTMAVPCPVSAQQEWFDAAKKFVGADSLEAMRRLPVSTFDGATRAIAPVGMMIYGATIDDVHYSADWRSRNASANPDTFEVLIGDCVQEYTVFESVLENIRRSIPRTTESAMPTAKFYSTLCTILPRAKVDKFLAGYDIGLQTSGPELVTRLFQIMNDCNFAGPTQAYAETTAAEGKTVYRYLFDELNPFGGPSFKRRANHALDLPFLYGAPDLFDKAPHPDWEKTIHGAIQEKWIGFAYGERLWRPLAEGGFWAFGPDGRTGEIGEDEAKERREMRRWESWRGLKEEEVKGFVAVCAKQMRRLVLAGRIRSLV